MAAYLFNGFNLNDGVNFYTLGKNLDFPQINESLLKIARLEGSRRSGVDIKPRQIQLRVKIVGSSRNNLESLIDSMYTALSTQSSQLSIHSLDGRYYIADCVGVKTQLMGNNPLAAIADLSFLAQIPYAYAASPTTINGTSIIMAGPGTFTGATPLIYTYSTGGVGAGGNVWTYPSIQITLQTPSSAQNTTSPITHGIANTAITTTPLADNVAVGDTFVLGFGSANTQTIVANGTASAGGGGFSTQSYTTSVDFGAGSLLYKGAPLGSALNNGTPYTSLSFGASGAPVAISINDTFIINYGGGSSQTVVASNTAAKGAASVPCYPFTANANYSTGAPVLKDVRPSSLTYSETTDSRAITITNTQGLFAVTGEYMTIQCDPTVQTTGYTITKDGGTTALPFTGIFPVMQPGTTAFEVSLTSPSVPTLQVTWTFTNRWLS